MKNKNLNQHNHDNAESQRNRYLLIQVSQRFPKIFNF